MIKRVFAMAERLDKNGLQVAAELVAFVEDKALPGTGVSADTFWSGMSRIVHELGPKNRALLETRTNLQGQVDAWHIARKGQVLDAAEYTAFLSEIGYLVPEGADFDGVIDGFCERFHKIHFQSG